MWGLLALAAAGALAYAARRPLLTAAGAYLLARDTPHPADAIVVLSGSVPDRMLAAVDLYDRHLAPRIILTREAPLPGIEALRARGGRLLEHYEQNLSVARQLGVPESALTVLPPPVTSTWQEACVVVAYLRRQGIHSILLVTSKTHSRRARLTFRAVAGGALEIAVYPSPYDPFEADDWWRQRGLVRRVLTEYAKLAYFLLVDRWRGPLPPAPPP
jgi:uncharacterized SAM-binding protein YcdF (DUF218 family)